ncbi:MAG: RiPP maturation radical SAM C-methyltransferase [Desulfobacterales bacterium]|nr:RiPP maturation radical SAM C-methyltransferase [Desulfobacterales bacterium]
MSDVVLVNPPFGNAIAPSIGLGILKARLKNLQINTEVYYANIDFCAQISFEVYHLLVGLDNRVMMLGEAVFAEYVYDNLTDPLPILFNNDNHPGYFIIGTLSKDYFTKIRGLATEFLDNTVKTILSKNPRIVGFTSKFYQNLAAFAIAKMIKEKRPDILTVIGGPNVWLPMGKALSEITPWIDYIFAGEAEELFPSFCSDFLSGKEINLPKVIDCGIYENITPNPTPDYDDYFSQIKPYQNEGKIPDKFPLYLAFETSRGCWWAKKSPCFFCGLNPDLSYRRKTSEKALEEIIQLSSKYNIKSLFATDNVIPPEYLNELIIELSSKKTGVSLFYEVRPTLTSSQIEKLSSGGVNMVQAGIESLITQVLNEMNKGVTAVQNILFLRECKSFKIDLFWSFIIGIPNEKKYGYELFCDIGELLYHLKPPMTASVFRLNRFSEYFNNYEKYGIKNMRPYKIMESLYPKGSNLYELSYFFDRDHTTELIEDKPLLERFVNIIKKWNELWMNAPSFESLPKLELNENNIILDTRPCAINAEFICDKESLEILNQFSTPKKIEDIKNTHNKSFIELLNRRFILEYEGYYLSLVNKSG